MTLSETFLLRVVDLSIQFTLPNLPVQTVLRNVNFTLERASVNFLTGGNGVGKTSLLKALIGLLPSNSTTSKEFIHMPNGETIGSEDLPSRLKIGYIPQHPHEALVPSFNVSENVAFRKFLRGNTGFSDWLLVQRYGKQTEESIHALVDSFDIVKNLLGEKLNDGVLHLSGGEQQIVNLAAMIFDECDLLIMDEPTSKLDQVNRARFWAFISEIKKLHQHTMLIVTHDTSVTDASGIDDRIFVIENCGVTEQRLPEAEVSGIAERS